MKPHVVFGLAASLCACPSALPRGEAGGAVSVELRTDDGRSLPLYPAASRGGATRVYAEARRGDHYRIVVHNRLDRRVGLVIAVDGRNIISGQPSWLKNSERMYVLGPHETQDYEGWRTAQDRVHRFYFTDAPDSYAGAFGDESAMGVVAVAAYAEVQHWQPPRRWREGWGAPTPGTEQRAPAEAPPPADALGSGLPCPAPSAKAAPKAPLDRADSRAGTGYGSEAYSPSYTVAFEAEGRPLERTLIKYEWRETLCRLGILPRFPTPPPNRLWDEGYAPPPPRSY